MIKKERLDRLNGIIRKMQKSGQGERTFVATWLRCLLEELEPEQGLLFLTTSLEELRNTSNWLKERIEGMMTFAEQFPEFQHRDSSDHVKIAFLDYLTSGNKAYSLGISGVCVVLYNACSDDVLASEYTTPLEVWGEDTNEMVLTRLAESNVPVNPDRVLKCFREYADCEKAPF